ncbi:MAG: anthranilate synthase component I [Ignavibacteriales bacterium CG_4_9_14_3_um_filter_34_10]|nr:MAG: anthranilate synthase component I [Ignavibacteriales bacterium CG_4_9_14_3_um_filter_34_10]
MNLNRFKELAMLHNKIPVYEKITADLLTPVLAYLKIREHDSFSFLLESVEGIGRLARYSFISTAPSKVFNNIGNDITITENGSSISIKKNIFDFLSEEISKTNDPKIDELPDFTGGIVGYLGYENISLIENVIKFDGINEIDIPDSIFGVFNLLIAFDHYKHQIILIKNVEIDPSIDLDKAFYSAKKELTGLREKLKSPFDKNLGFSSFDFADDQNTDSFFSLVNKCKSNILEGDIFQIVLSKRFSAKYTGDLINVYRALRIINPSPYMYFMEISDTNNPQPLTIIGTSPEDLLKVNNNHATILPIAGTRRRGKNPQEDLEIENELLADPKEIAEHTMLVDLARNDLGRVCTYGSVEVTEEMTIHKFSHVMHIVSRVEGILEENKNCIDALKASFPAGTVSGAPKIRAIQLLNDYEKLKRNIYAGAVGYIDFKGNLDMCIAIRTLFAFDDKIYWQAGAGIVADSKPELEFKEINNKSAVLLNALKFAEVIDENISD